MKDDCKHRRVITYVDGTSEPAGLWGCADCHDRFAPITKQIELEAENKRLRSALTMIREITGQDSVFHEADSALAGQGGECEHDWIDARNEVTASGEWCRKCNAIRAGQGGEDEL